LNKANAVLTGIAAAAVAGPALAVGLHWALPLDFVGAGLAYIWTYNWAARPPSRAKIDEARLGQSKYKTARALLNEGMAALARLRRVGRSVRDRSMRREIKELYKTAKRAIDHVRADPDKAMPARRLFTFYLPNAASVAEGWVSLEQQASPSMDRARQTRITVRDLNSAFAKFADDLAEPQLQGLDVDLKLLNEAMKRDLEKA
jgi:5-bromo-4-chloroindolyl phosphate hydrolysis protein